MDWIEISNKEILPEEEKTYWVTINFLGGFISEGTYRKGKWYDNRRHVMSDVVAWYNVPKPEIFKIPEPEGMVFPEYSINKNGNNKKLKVNILHEDRMRKFGFTDNKKDTWYYCKMLKGEISFSISINKENPEDFRIDVLDDDFCQPYDYQYMLSKNKNHKYAKAIMEKVEEQMEKLQSWGIVEGHIYGEYI